MLSAALCVFGSDTFAEAFNGVWAMYEPQCAEFMVPVESCPKNKIQLQVTYEIAIVQEGSRICGRWHGFGVQHYSGYLAGRTKGNVAHIRIGEETSHSTKDAFPNHGWQEEMFRLENGKLFTYSKGPAGKMRRDGRGMVRTAESTDLVSRMYADDEVHPGRTKAFLKACFAGSNYSMQPTPNYWRG